MTPPAHRVAALDLGTRRIGVAACDELGVSVRPLGVIPCIGAKRDAQSLRQMLDGLNVRLLVVGLPLLDSGDEGASAARCRVQGDDLARRLQLPIEYSDESDTTVEAQRILRSRGAASKDAVDALAAAIILEEWLARQASSESAP